MKTLTLSLFLPLLFLFSGWSLTTLSAQDTKVVKREIEDTPEPFWTVTTRIDVRSRWIYRGIELGNSPQIQPTITFNHKGFTAGVWTSHSMSLSTDAEQPGANYRETNIWMQYAIDLGSTVLTPYVQNHYNPVNDFFDFSENGSHLFQTQLFWTGKEIPFDLMGGWVFYGDDDNSLYLEAGYTFDVHSMKLRTFISGTPDKSGFNGTQQAGVTQVGFQITRSLPITEKFSLPLTAQFMANPYQETTFAALIVSF